MPRGADALAVHLSTHTIISQAELAQFILRAATEPDEKESIVGQIHQLGRAPGSRIYIYR